MTTKTIDSTVSQLLQDKPSVESVAPEKNPITTVQSDELIFGQKHNDIDCALCPTAKRACDRAWCTARNLEEWSEMPKKTLWRWLEKLEKAHRISLVSDMTLVNVPTTTGAKSTTFYNLNVLNQLAMVCIDNEKLNDVSCKFSDILSEVETTGSYGMPQISRKDQLYLAIIHSESEEERADALKELAEINKQEVKALTAERDEAIRTKTQYQSNLAAQMSGRVGGLTAALNRARTENDRLKGDRFTVDDIYIIMNTSDVSFTLKDPKAVIRNSMNLFSKEMGEPYPKVPLKQREIKGKMIDVSGFVYTEKAVQAYFEFVEANPMGWQARNRKMIMYGWLREKLISYI